MRIYVDFSENYYGMFLETNEELMIQTLQNHKLVPLEKLTHITDWKDFLESNRYYDYTPEEFGYEKEFSVNALYETEMGQEELEGYLGVYEDYE